MAKSFVPGFTVPATLSSDYAIEPTPIRQLQIDAEMHGDANLVETCTAALAGDERAIAICERIIASSQEKS